MHKTKKALIDAVIELMDGNPAADVTLQQVLAHSKITSGSLYYHFSDFHDLIDQAHVRMFGDFAEDIAARISIIVAESETGEETNRRLSPAIEARHIPDFSRMRSARAWIAAQAMFRPSLGEKLETEQRRITEDIADVIAEAQQRGIAQEGFDPYAIAVFIQAYTMGRIVDDLAGAPMDELEWTRFIKHVVATAILKF